jgi:phosphosulfolactate synthase (CoM biosynthesis protein A)
VVRHEPQQYGNEVNFFIDHSQTVEMEALRSRTLRHQEHRIQNLRAR